MTFDGPTLSLELPAGRAALTRCLPTAGGVESTSYRRCGGTFKRGLAIHGGAFALCVGILVGNVYEKFEQGAWVTVAVTSVVIGTGHGACGGGLVLTLPSPEA